MACCEDDGVERESVRLLREVGQGGLTCVTSQKQGDCCPSYIFLVSQIKGLLTDGLHDSQQLASDLKVQHPTEIQCNSSNSQQPAVARPGGGDWRGVLGVEASTRVEV